jgi:type I restriction enzyme R subunit
LALLGKIKENMSTEQAHDEYKKIMDIVSWDSLLRKKKGMIEEFISFNMPSLKEWADIAKEFDLFQNQKKLKAFEGLCSEEKLDSEWMKKILSAYEFTGKDPLREDISKVLTEKYWLLERRKVVDRVYGKIMKFVDVYTSVDNY